MTSLTSPSPRSTAIPFRNRWKGQWMLAVAVLHTLYAAVVFPTQLQEIVRRVVRVAGLGHPAGRTQRCPGARSFARAGCRVAGTHGAGHCAHAFLRFLAGAAARAGPVLAPQR